jgi:signal peptidase I
MFAPAWKKNAKALVKGAGKFLDYKRDLLKEERVGEIESRKKDLIQAIAVGSREKVDEASKFLRAACDGALPRQKPQGWFEENVEVIFVAIVIALGLRAYYLQPFRIPTGSMQPTLNGIVGHPLEKEKWPSFPERVWEFVTKGRTYERMVNDRDRRVVAGYMPTEDGLRVVGDVKDFQWWHFFSRSNLYSKDAGPLRLPAPAGQSYDMGLSRALEESMKNGGILKKGQVLLEGFVDTGDLVLVDKISYHFRKPKRGEVFVFDTIGIKGIKEHSTGPQGGGSHYIKRLVGVPGDELSIQTPDLLVNGKVASEAGIRRVAEGGPPFSEKHKGYVVVQPSKEMTRYLVEKDGVLSLKDEGAKPGMREYAAMGDNTGNSLDSRYWGSVKEFNLVGPALFSLWPFDTGHWGFIK